MLVQQRVNTLFDERFIQFSGKTQIELHFEFPGYDVFRTGPGVNIGDLKTGRREVIIAPVPLHGNQFAECRRCQVKRVGGQMRVGDVSLFSPDGQHTIDRTTAAILDYITQGVDTGGFTDQTPVYFFMTRFECFDNLDGAVNGRAFLVTGN